MKAWHYTIGRYYRMIVWSGELLPINEYLHPKNERALLWFSLNQEFEPTARKGLHDQSGRFIRTLTVAETKEMGGGLFRFGIDPTRLLAGERLRRAARIPPSIWRRLHSVGKVQGADPDHWFGTTDAVGIAELVIETMDEAGNWVGGGCLP